MKKYILMVFTLLVVAGFQCPPQKQQLDVNNGPEDTAEEQEDIFKEDLQLQTSDGISIAATLFPGLKEKKSGIVLIHMLGRDRSDWNDFAIQLQEDGFHVLTIDLRSHGESPGDWTRFDAEDFQNMVLDVEAAKNYFKNQDPEMTIKLVGASIGANVVLNYAVKDTEIESIALLSPGLDYRGVKTKDAITKYNKEIFIATSEDDKESHDSSQKLFQAIPESGANKYFQVYENAGHGTNMLDKDLGLDQLLIGFLNNNLTK